MAENLYPISEVQTEERSVCREILNNILDIWDEYSFPCSVSFSKKEKSNMYLLRITYMEYDAKCVEWIFERADHWYNQTNKVKDDGEE